MKTNRELTPAQLAFDKPRALKECSPKNWTMDTGVYFPVVVNFDVTGNGMCDLPQFFWDDVPVFVENACRMVPALFEDMPTFYFAGVGDIRYDDAPLQITNGAAFTARGIRHVLAKLWLEKGGGGGTDIENLCESYEMMAYFLAKRFRLWDNAPHPTYQTCIFVADEAPRLTLEKIELDLWLGGSNTTTDTASVFEELKRTFKGNVFLIYRPTFDGKEGKAILAAWRTLLGEDNILVLPSDRLITAAIRELITVVAANHTLADAQKKLNEMAPKAVAREQPAVPQESLTATPNVTPTLQKPSRKPRPLDAWRLQPKTDERPTRPTSRKRKTPTGADAFRL